MRNVAEPGSTETAARQWPLVQVEQGPVAHQRAALTGGDECRGKSSVLRKKLHTAAAVATLLLVATAGVVYVGITAQVLRLPFADVAEGPPARTQGGLIVREDSVGGVKVHMLPPAVDLSTANSELKPGREQDEDYERNAAQHARKVALLRSKKVLPAVESQKAAVPDFGKNPGGFLPELSPKALGDLNQLFFTAYSNEIVNSGYWFDNSQLLFPSLAYPTANQAAGSQYMQNNVNLRWHFSWTWSYHQPSNRVVLLMSVMDLSQFVSSGASSGNFGFSGTLTVSAPIHAVAAPSVDLLHYSAIGQSLAKMNGAPEAEASMPEAGSLMFSSQRTGAGAGGEQLEQVQFMNKRDVDIEQQERQHDDQDDSPARPNVVDPLQYGVAAASEASMVGAMVGGDDRSSLFFNAFANYVKAYRWALKSALLFPTLQYPYNNHIHGSQTTGPNLAQTFSLSWTWAVRGADVRLTVQLAEFCQHVTADFPNGSIIERRGEKYCLDGSVTLRQWGGMVSVASANWHQQRG